MRALPWLLLLALGCGSDDDVVEPDAGPLPVDAGEVDAEVDAGPPVDAGPGECFAETHDAIESGSCEAVVVDPLATLPVGDDGDGGYIVPGARRVTRVGRTVALSGFPMAVRRVADTRFALVSDGGVQLEQLSVVDLDTMEVVDRRELRGADEALFRGLAFLDDASRVFASGGGTNEVFVYDFDADTGALTDAGSHTFASTTDEGYVSSLHLMADQQTLLVTLMFGAQLVVFDLETETETARIPLLEGARAYDTVVTPDESMAFVSLWNEGAVQPVDLTTREAGTPIGVGKNPEGLALSPDGATLVVADSDSDSLSIIDVGTLARTEQLYLVGESAPRGTSPSAGAFGPGDRFYVVAAGDNAVEVYDTTDWSRIGRIPTMWYPTDVRALEDGGLLVVNGKHEGTGANLDPGTDDITDLVGGSLTRMPPEDIEDDALVAWDLEITENNERAARFQAVECEGGDYDFPVPMPGMGPSEQIKHVVLVIRENKTYDAYFGNLERDGTPIGDGDPTLTLVPPDEIEGIIPNTRELARTFAMGDNYYSLAEQSVQGHVWTTMGRTTDFVERSWLTTWGRAYWGVPPQGVFVPLGYPEEGSAFDYFFEQGVEVDNYGEIVASRSVPPNGRYPGLVYNMGVPDERKARWLQTRWQIGCELRDFTYIVLPNDHTFGRSPGRPTPRAMMADNDYGVGIIAEALSHSTFWAETLLVVIEDDPQDGGDHVDNHRAPLLMISPWVKRGHVSSVHYNEASIYRTIQLILGIDAPLNASWANASPMYEMFTAEPDLTPYTAIERTYPEELNPEDGSDMMEESLQWDFSRPDEQPGLSRMLWRHLRGSTPPWAVNRDVLLEVLEEELEDDDAAIDE